MLRVAVIDGQGGRIGRLLVESIKNAKINCELIAIGTNSTATSAMLKAGADAGATGENPVIVACRDCDVVICPIGLLIADALLGEVTPKMALAIGQSQATKLLLPVTQCSNIIVGAQSIPITQLVSIAVTHLEKVVSGECPQSHPHHCSGGHGCF